MIEGCAISSDTHHYLIVISYWILFLAYFLCSYASGKLKFAQVFKVAYTMYGIPWFIEQMDFS
jgi:hypothetical protein